MKTLRPTLLFALLLTFTTFCFAQNKYQIRLKVSPIKAELRSIIVNQDSTCDVFIGLDPDGIARVGTSRQGTIEYWGTNDGAHRKNKTKTLAGVPQDFYDSFDVDKTGKLKSFGRMVVDYYTRFDGFDNIGKVKSIDGVIFKYYDRFDGDPKLTGRLKSVGDDKITYYSQFDGFDNIGKLKSIGNTVITYFDRFSGREYLGRVKSVKGTTPTLYVTQE
ncbi:hypothetical protein KXQ82_16350 [Mucilaginibacter sp. HMF5004]|uniref:hypothetical protein n=1 Tax=Mucilaginibacter rivuli TaxID=2857527 RepID=UPI001C5EFE8D|nr:hypothetical protein [Mucilaginibacter rivuli]MBW4891300.1 hypothetical protein [Mucilaginibacter rivuli]